MSESGGPVRTMRAALIWVSFASAAFLLWRLRPAILLLLGSIVAAILLRQFSLLICRVTHIRYGWALVLATLIIILCAFYCLWTFGTSLVAQFGALFSQVQAGEKLLTRELARIGMKNTFVSEGLAMFRMPVQPAVSIGLQAIEATLILVISAIYLAAEPEVYHRGLATLFPEGIRAKAMKDLDVIGSALRQWLLGQLVLMLVVGLGSYIAVLIIGLPNALALGLVAGLTEIIPYIGPFIGAVPAVLVALSHGGPTSVLFTIAAYLLLHFIEGYAVGPLLQKHFVRIPPVLILASLFAAPLIFGTPGFLLAAPLAVVIFTAVKAAYVRETLGEAVDLPSR